MLPNRLTELRMRLVRLNAWIRAVHFQIFVHPKGVEGGGIETGQEHIDHDQQVKLLVFHPQRDILVIILETLAVGGVVGAEHSVVIPDGRFQKIPVGLGQAAGVLAVFLAQDAVLLRSLAP